MSVEAVLAVPWPVHYSDVRNMTLTFAEAPVCAGVEMAGVAAAVAGLEWTA
jgi:hypothetical protein